MATPFTMSNITGLPSLVILQTTYCDYFARSNTDTFRGNYASVFHPYPIEA